MKSDSRSPGSGGDRSRSDQTAFDEEVSGFVVSCLLAARKAYPRPINVDNVSASSSSREVGQQMLQTLGEAGLLHGELSELTFTLAGYRTLQRASNSDPELSAMIEGSTEMQASEFILALLREHAAGVQSSQFGGL